MIQELESRINSLSNPMPSAPGQAFQGMIDNALSVANSRLASLKKAHNQLLSRYYDLEIKYIELQADQELSTLPVRHGSMDSHQSSPHQSQYNDMHSSHTLSDSEGSQYRAASRGGHNHSHNRYHSEESLSQHPNNHAGDYSGQNMYFSPAERLQGNVFMSSGYTTSPPQSSSGSKYSGMGFLSPEPQDPHRLGPGGTLRHKPSIVGSTFSSSDSQSMRTVTSTTSSEKKRQEKIKASSEIRIRGRGL